MKRFNPNWFERVLRNTAEVSSDGGTVVIRETPEVVEVPTAPTVGETLGTAAAVIDMANSLNQATATPDRSGEMIALLSEIRDDMRALRAQQSITPPVEVIVETPEPETPPVVNEPEVIVNTGELKKEEIKTPLEEAPTEKPKSRSRRWI